MDFPKLEPGATIAGRYELLDKLGAGAFGAVFRARQLGIDRHVAVKILLPEAASADSTAIARFQREAKLSSSLGHPNTITVHDFGEWSGLLYLVMEYVRGESLREVLRRTGPMEPKRVVRIVRQILSSLQEAHSRGIIHRDMKPANIMLFDRVGESDVVKVLDFGIAKFISNDAAASSAQAVEKDLTVAGRIVGTPRYMAPEQIRGTGPSPRSDLYALGLIFFEMITGQQAVAGDSTLSLIAAQLSGEPVVDARDPRLPAALAPIIERATAKDSDDRFANAAEFIEALDVADLATDSTISLPTAAPDKPAEDTPDLLDESPEPTSHNWGAAVAMGAVVIVLLAAVGGTAYHFLPGDEEAAAVNPPQIPATPAVATPAAAAGAVTDNPDPTDPAPDGAVGGGPDNDSTGPGDAAPPAIEGEGAGDKNGGGDVAEDPLPEKRKTKSKTRSSQRKKKKKKKNGYDGF